MFFYFLILLSLTYFIIKSFNTFLLFLLLILPFTIKSILGWFGLNSSCLAMFWTSFLAAYIIEVFFNSTLLLCEYIYLLFNLGKSLELFLESTDFLWNFYVWFAIILFFSFLFFSSQLFFWAEVVRLW